MRIIASNKRTKSSSIDVLCRIQDNTSLLNAFGPYLVVECKQWKEPANSAVIREFAARLLSFGVSSGILASKMGITGATDTKDAALELVKVYQRHRLAIIVLDLADLNAIANGRSVTDVLVEHYEMVRFDLAERKIRTSNQAKSLGTSI